MQKLQRELKNHEGLVALNKRRYEEKVRDAVNDEDGVKALEDLLQTEPDLAELFGSRTSGHVGAKSAKDGLGGKVNEPPEPFKGADFPTFFSRTDGSTVVDGKISKGEIGRVYFKTDVKNDYFSRHKHRGIETFSGNVIPTTHLFNGRYSLTFAPDKTLPVGTKLTSEVMITDNVGSGPFKLAVNITITEPAAKKKSPPRPVPLPKSAQGPSSINIKDVKEGKDGLPLTIQPVPDSEQLQLLLNVESKFLDHAKSMRPNEESAAVEFVFKYGLALSVLALIDKAKRTTEWKDNQALCREQIEDTAGGIARVIVPLCLSLPKKLPKSK